MNIDELVEMYILDKKLAWSPTTIKSERHRLRAASPALDGNPNTLWNELERRGMHPHSRRTTWIRVCCFYNWLIEEGHYKGANEYEKFKKKNARVFKNVYERKPASISYQEAVEKISQITSPMSKHRALSILGSGMRVAETTSYDGNRVIGKGSKARRVYLGGIGKETVTTSYRTFLRHLAKVGLKPHELRKIFLTEFVNKGANVFELCEVAGWSNLDSAQSYIATNKDTIKMKVQQVQEGLNNGFTQK